MSPGAQSRLGGGTATDQDVAAQGLPFRRTGAGGAGGCRPSPDDGAPETSCTSRRALYRRAAVQNMTGDPEQEYFADGMVEEIMTALSRFKSFFVIARNSNFTFKGKA